MQWSTTVQFGRSAQRVDLRDQTDTRRERPACRYHLVHLDNANSQLLEFFIAGGPVILSSKDFVQDFDPLICGTPFSELVSYPFVLRPSREFGSRQARTQEGLLLAHEKSVCLGATEIICSSGVVDGSTMSARRAVGVQKGSCTTTVSGRSQAAESSFKSW